MPDVNGPSTASGDPLDAVIAAYVQQVEAGAVPDREALLARHPDLAERLRAYFADCDRLDRQAGDLRLAQDSNRTADGEEQPGGRPHVRYFGDYELLEVVARGGMGVVYKARQVSLNRLVALKMILQAALAAPRDLARFRAEAEAAAILDHPNIVPIYEVGEHHGQQYYAMRFIEGTSLARQPRADPRTETQRLTAITRAVYHAHQRGILHRDLKPSNILVDTAGTPFVTDFGLAKRVDGNRSLTESGAVVGTPRYMAPEQASARKDLTVAADVYSLGVVLYERLTGRTPFSSEDILELLLQVREDKPPRPSAITPGLNRDLETVCLKCLEKEPAKRYASAEALADDLDRWLRGEPILARPVGPAERWWRWCRRNPALAGLSSGLALTLAAGTGISLAFAFRAEERAQGERSERQRAEQAEDRAITAQKDLERALGRSLIRPLDPAGPAGLSEPEIEALWELAEKPGERMWLAFVTEAMRSRFAARQFGARPEQALVAAIGLDREKRRRVEQLLAEQLRSPDLSPSHQLDLLVVAITLGELDSPGDLGLPDRFQQLVSQLAGKKDRDIDPERVARLLAGCVPELKPALAVEVLTRALAKEGDSSRREVLARALPPVVERLEPEKATRVLGQAAGVLTGALENEGHAPAQNALFQGLAAVAGRLEPGEVAALLTRALEKKTSPNVPQALVQGLGVAAGRLAPREAGRLAAVLTGALEKDTDANRKAVLVQALGVVTGRLAPPEAAAALTRALEKEQDSGTKLALAQGLVPVIERLERGLAVRVAGQVAGVLTRALEAGVLTRDREVERARDLAAVSGRLEPTEALKVCKQAGEMITRALGKATDSWQKAALAQGLAAVAERMEPGDAARVLGQAAGVLTQALENEGDGNAQNALVQELATVAGRLEPREVATLLTRALEKKTSPRVPPALLQGLGAAAGRPEPREAGRAAGVLVGALEKATDAGSKVTLAQAVAAVAGRLEPGEAARVAGQVAGVLTRALEKEADANQKAALAQGLATVAERLQPAEALQVSQQTGDVLTASLQKATDDGSKQALVGGLVVVAQRLEPNAGARVLTRALDQTVIAHKPTARSVQDVLAQACATVAQRLDPEKASQLCSPLLENLLARAELDKDWYEGRNQLHLATSLLQPMTPKTAALYSGKLARSICSGDLSLAWINSSYYAPVPVTAALLADSSRGEVRPRATAAAAAVGLAAQGPFVALASLHTAGKPLPCRLSTQDLVDLLKMPTCFGPSRQAILQQLGNLHDQKFANHWEFVRYAQEHLQHLKLDFTTPPKRPGRT
jgi:hypothetical protein